MWGYVVSAASIPLHHITLNTLEYRVRDSPDSTLTGFRRKGYADAMKKEAAQYTIQINDIRGDCPQPGYLHGMITSTQLCSATFIVDM